MRARLEQHRANAVCASCHKLMDPIGFALESFDAVGKFRTFDENFEPIDNTGVYADGTTHRRPGRAPAGVGRTTPTSSSPT